MKVDKRAMDNKMVQMGFRDKLLGAGMIRDAVELYRPGKRMLKDVYADLAIKYQTSQTAVERCIRFAIKDAAQHGRGDVWAELFGGSIYAVGDVPSNTTFIARMAQYFSIED